VRKNAQRLSQIVEEILNLARVQHQALSDWLELDRLVDAVRGATGTGWRRPGERLQLVLRAGGAWSAFDGDHLRRMLVNLLDNALRYASQRAGAIQVATDTRRAGRCRCGATARRWRPACSATCSSPSSPPRAAPAAWACTSAASCATATARASRTGAARRRTAAAATATRSRGFRTATPVAATGAFAQ
jgi:hypothetical protein